MGRKDQKRWTFQWSWKGLESLKEISPPKRIMSLNTTPLSWLSLRMLPQLRQGLSWIQLYFLHGMYNLFYFKNQFNLIGMLHAIMLSIYVEIWDHSSYYFMCNFSLKKCSAVVLFTWEWFWVKQNAIVRCFLARKYTTSSCLWTLVKLFHFFFTIHNMAKYYHS